MKLRIKDASIRLRLTQTEVDQIAAEGRVEGVVPFGPGVVFRYALAVAPGDTALRATYDAHTITISLPEDWAADWASSDQVGFEAMQDVGDGETLGLLIEKDFACLHEDRDEPDAYPNPFAEAEGA